MIIEYQRPKSIHEALILLAREHPVSYPLAGGTIINSGIDREIAVIDLQALGLGSISKGGNSLHVGATATLQELLEYQGLLADIYTAVKLEATYNLRQMATIGGTLVCANGRSPLVTVLLALNTSLELQSLGAKAEQVKLGDWLPIRDQSKPGKLITSVEVPANILLAYEYIARSPADQPIVCAAVGQWESGRTRLALGGWGAAPVLALDGPTADGIEMAAQSAYSTAQDEWGTAEYRREMAAILARRCMLRIHPHDSDSESKAQS